jgi:hypothetical protein
MGKNGSKNNRAYYANVKNSSAAFKEHKSVKMVEKNNGGCKGRLWVVPYFERYQHFGFGNTPQVGNAF